jgi:hypothetical protein
LWGEAGTRDGNDPRSIVGASDTGA